MRFVSLLLLIMALAAGCNSLLKNSGTSKYSGNTFAHNATGKVTLHPSSSSDQYGLLKETYNSIVRLASNGQIPIFRSDSLKNPSDSRHFQFDSNNLCFQFHFVWQQTQKLDGRKANLKVITPCRIDDQGNVKPLFYTGLPALRQNLDKEQQAILLDRFRKRFLGRLNLQGPDQLKTVSQRDTAITISSINLKPFTGDTTGKDSFLYLLNQLDSLVEYHAYESRKIKVYKDHLLTDTLSQSAFTLMRHVETSRIYKPMPEQRPLYRLDTFILTPFKKLDRHFRYLVKEQWKPTKNGVQSTILAISPVITLKSFKHWFHIENWWGQPELSVRGEWTDEPPYTKFRAAYLGDDNVKNKGNLYWITPETAEKVMTQRAYARLMDDLKRKLRMLLYE